jgi:phage terminase small subunit
MTDSQQRKFTAKQRKFIDEYVLCLNATKAAIRAGYSEKTAKDIGCENLAKPNIKAEIARIIKENTISPEEVLQQLSRMATLDMEDMFDFPGNAPIFNADKARENGAMQIIDGFKITDKEMTIKLPSKQKALELMAKYHGLLIDTLKVETWQDRAVDDIRKGIIAYEDLAQEFDDDLATELFTRAGVPISLSEDTES